MRAPRPQPRSHPPRLKSILALALFAILAMATEAAPAFAHAAFLESQPAPGQRVESSPSEITLEFTEALNRRLSRATITDLRTGKERAISTLPGPSRDLVLRPAAALPTAAYRVDWFSVSADDGHPLQGSFSFGVRTAAVGGAHVIEQSPLARDGWLRIALRAFFYAALFFFAGGVLNGALLSGRQGRARWLVPPGELRFVLAADGQVPEAIATLAWRRTVSAAWLAAAAAAAVAVAEAADAAGGLSLRGLNDYLLTNAAGLGRVATVLALTLVALVANRLPRLGVLACATALGAIALSGHANSADPRALAMLADWVHLLAAAIWIGGVAQIVVTWTRRTIAGAEALRRSVMMQVLRPFGRIALPVFLVVVASGLLNALIELGDAQALWQTGYGRALAVKMGLVGLIAMFGYVHARRLRPRILAANPHPDPKQERRHWRLLRGEPAIGVAVLVIAALLVAYPLPPRQLSGAEGAAALAAAPCQPSCPLPKLKPNQLAVADAAGSSIVAAWLRQGPTGLKGQLRLFNTELQAPAGKPILAGAVLRGCGPGCWSFRLAGHPRTITVSVPEGGKLYTARLPARWQAGARANALARRLLGEVQGAMNRLRTVREYERVTSGPGSLAVSHYRIQSPDRFAIRTGLGAHSITVGKYTWEAQQPGPVTAKTHWVRSRYAGGGPGFTTGSWFRWTPYAQAVRLLYYRRINGRRIAEVALYDQGTPAWWRFRIDLNSMRATDSRLIAQGHYMTQRYYDYNQSMRIAPPPSAHGG